jgi:NAD(P)-dependent dehydrogenase (short-subunit alcohol dehydrogenase family)
LVNCAGALSGTPNKIDKLFETSDYEHVINTDLNSTFYMIKYSYPHMHNGGSIINISSIASIRAYGVTNYSIAKAGINGMTTDLGMSLASLKIRVNAILPGLIRTEISESNFAVGEEAVVKAIGIPLNRPGEPEDIAYTALFLASDASSFTTGQLFLVDGGTSTLGSQSFL